MQFSLDKISQAHTGSLYLIDEDKAPKQLLAVSVYKNTPSPFAVFSHQGKRTRCCEESAYLALNDWEAVPMSDKTFKFSTKKERVGKGPSYLMFEATSREDRDKWVKILKANTVRKTSCCGSLPTIAEYDDGEEVTSRIKHEKGSLISV